MTQRQNRIGGLQIIAMGLQYKLSKRLKKPVAEYVNHLDQGVTIKNNFLISHYIDKYFDLRVPLIRSTDRVMDGWMDGL